MEVQLKQSPIFSKTYDFLLWLLQHTEKFPKSERFRLARRLEDTCFNFHELLIQSAHSSQARLLLGEGDFLLDKLRLYLRLAHARHLFDMSQYEFACNGLMEIGRLLGGWMKSLPANAEHPGDSGISFAGRLVEQQ
jgi:hypothetical protein